MSYWPSAARSKWAYDVLTRDIFQLNRKSEEIIVIDGNWNIPSSLNDLMKELQLFMHVSDDYEETSNKSNLSWWFKIFVIDGSILILIVWK